MKIKQLYFPCFGFVGYNGTSATSTAQVDNVDINLCSTQTFQLDADTHNKSKTNPGIYATVESLLNDYN